MHEPTVKRRSLPQCAGLGKPKLLLATAGGKPVSAGQHYGYTVPP